MGKIMWRYAIVIIGVSLIASQGAQYYEKMAREEKALEQIQAKAQPRVAVVEQSKPKPHQPRFLGKAARIAMDKSGHFITNAKMNGRVIKVLVDTGATTVAINKTTARRIGLRLSKSDFKHQVNTANGKTAAAVAEIERIKIGKVEVRNVAAVVLDDKSLSSTLLGMSFLNQLDRFEVRNQELILRQ